MRLSNSAPSRKLIHNLKRVETRLVETGEVPPEHLFDRIATDLGVTPKQVVSMHLQALPEDPDADVEKEVGARLESRAF